MQKGNLLQFSCLSCKKPVKFSVFELELTQKPIECSQCSKKYVLDDEIFIRQIKKFVALCKQIQLSEEILGDTSVGIQVGEREVKVPYKLLLTRFTSSLDLNVGGEPMTITFRLEPLQDVPDMED